MFILCPFFLNGILVFTSVSGNRTLSGRVTSSETIRCCSFESGARISCRFLNRLKFLSVGAISHRFVQIPYRSISGEVVLQCKYSINSLVYWVTYVHNVVYSFYRSMIYCYINSTQRCAGSIVIDIIPTNGADKRKFFPFAPYFPVTNVIKRYFYPYFPAIIGIKGYSFPYFPYLSGIMKIKTALYSLFSRLDWHKTVVFPCLGEIYEGIRSLSWEIPVT